MNIYSNETKPKTSSKKFILVSFNIIAGVGLFFILLTVILLFAADMTQLDVIQFINREILEHGFWAGDIMIPAYAPGGVMTYIAGCFLCLIGGLISKARFFRYSLIVLGCIIVAEFLAFGIIPLFSLDLQPPHGEGITAVMVLRKPLWALPGLVCVAEGLLLFRPFKKKVL